METCDVVIIGGGAAGLMCGRVAGRRGRSALILDHANRPAEKIRISGGGRCNFTNLHSTPAAFLSHNRHFCKSAFNRYTQDDFVQLVTRHQIAFHEKKLGQLFCDDSAQQIIDMLLDECRENLGSRVHPSDSQLGLEDEYCQLVHRQHRRQYVCNLEGKV